MTFNDVANYAVVALLIVWVLSRQLMARQVTVRKLFLLPIILAVLGISSLNSAITHNNGHFTSSDTGFLALDLGVSVVLGIPRGMSIQLYPQDGVLWRKGTWLTLGLWILSFAARAVIGLVAASGGASKIADDGLILSLGVSLAAQGVVVYLRGRQLGIPFAVDQRRRDRRF
jgi:hypothetical protein